MNKSFTRRRITLCLLFFCFVTASFSQDVVVAKDGTGNYTTVQAAIDAAPTARTTPYVILIKNGKYREKVTVPSNKPFLQLVGESVVNTIVYYDDPATILGTQNSASFTISADDFSAMNITFQNSYGDGSQAVAVLVNADRAAFKNCRFLGNQDTLYVKGNGTPRHYFLNCYIDGNTDFIFGSSIDVFDSCVIYAKSKAGVSTSYITAANTITGQAYGFVFRNCKVGGNTGITNYDLGRPWQSNPKVVYLNCALYNGILAEGWSTTSSAGSATFADSYFAEYKSRNMDGTLVDASKRATGSHQLSDAEAAGYTLSNMFGTWNPCAVINCTSAAPILAVSNFRGTKGSTTSTLNWNVNWPVDQLKFEIFRSTAKTTGFAKIGEVVAPNDTTYNFQATDPIPPTGSIYYYYIQSSKTGYATTVSSDTVVISSAPTINVSGSVGTFNQNLGTPSSSQSYTVSATDLNSNLIIIPPANFEVSTDGTTWYTNSSPLTLTPAGGTIGVTTINVRLNAAANGPYPGNIVHTSNGAVTVNLAVSGTTATPPSYTITTLQQWPLNVSNADSAAVRSSAVTASTPAFKSLTVSNGTAVPAIPAYSPTYGQAFGASSNGDGTWTTAVGGPGGNLNRNIYEQFTVTNQSSFAIRIDSIALTSAFYNTASSTKLGVVYSNSGFASDSSDVTGGVGPTGTLPGTTNGAFTTPVVLAQQNGGPTNMYGFALAGANGDTLAPGKTVTIRLYFSCSSSSSGRFGMLKNVMVKGVLSALATASSPFTQGNVVVVRVGDAATPISANTSPVYLDEYNVATNPVTLVQSIPVPTVTNNFNKRLTLTNSVYEGYLSRSLDGRYLTLAGYDAPTGSSTATSNTAVVTNRVVAMIDNFANINTTTSLTDFGNGNNPISAVSSDGNSIWVCANYSNGTGGTRYTTLGSGTTVQVNNTIGGNGPRVVNIFNGQLYVSNNTNSSVVAIGAGLPTTTNQAVNNLTGLPVGTGRAFQFFFADLNSAVAGADVLYIADDGSNGTANQGIQKYSLVSGSWMLNGSITVQGGSLRGVTGVVSGSTVTLLAVSPSGVFKYVDNTGYSTASGSFASATLSVYASPPSGAQFRGVALTPMSTTLPLQLLSFNAAYIGNKVNLWWNTTNEINTASFDVVRSADAGSFNTIATVAGTNNGASNSYRSTDFKPIDGVAYYRLKITDKDGSVKYSRVVAVNSSLKGSVTLYPNPVTSSVTVTFGKSGSNALAEVIALDGRKLITQKLPLNATQSTVDVSGLTAGMYMLSITNGTEKSNLKFIKQ